MTKYFTWFIWIFGYWVSFDPTFVFNKWNCCCVKQKIIWI